MSLPEIVLSERLSLELLTPDLAADIMSGRRRPSWHADFPRQDDRDGVSMYRPGDPWGTRLITRGGTTLGTIGFFGPPDPDDEVPEAEVGYGLVEEARGWGFATEALRALLVETDKAGVRIRASVEPGNTASLRILAKCGFTELRGSDEDGHLVMARPLPRP
ncbi:GNAT family N-acetyltransferase [Nocardioides sp.]|uniref:GNAT family N-acetyltransferase n=1 Tax=Nocardioides sp. TaxID=35761 RepID=UPI0031FE43F5|nr:GCN5-related N-acetyltransferase [Nocardioides sp.]